MQVEVGCGGIPAAGYDVYTDVYTPDVEIPGKFVLCAMENMPFGDKEFEYSRCHHVIEHTSNPDRALAELVRISRKGTLWFPTPQAELLFGRADHRWFVFVEGPKLVIVARRFSPYQVKAAVKKDVRFDWEGNIQWQVIS